MAYFGLSHPWVAKLNTETETYSGGKKCGKAMSTSVTPNFNEGSLSADNQVQEKIAEFKDAAVAVGTDRVPVDMAEMIFGHKMDAEGSETAKVGDIAPYVGYGFIVQEVTDGMHSYRACILLKVKFREGEESYETKGGSIVLKGSSLSGTAIGNSKGEWRKKSPKFDTEEEADEWIRKILAPAVEAVSLGKDEGE